MSRFMIPLKCLMFPVKQAIQTLHRDLYLPRLDGQGHPFFCAYLKAQHDSFLDVVETSPFVLP